MVILYKLMRERCLKADGLSSSNTHTLSLERKTVGKCAAELQLNEQSTAEHIRKLCKFLQEKSKRKQQEQQLQKHQELKNPTEKERLPKDNRRNTSVNAIVAKQSTFNRVSAINDQRCIRREWWPQEKRTLTGAISTQHHREMEVEEEPAGETEHCQDSPPSSQKRAVLLKIRHQIYERRKSRLMQGSTVSVSSNDLVLTPATVWRPW